MTNHGVDVIVPCYRYGHYLAQCVRSILTQSLSNVRVLILDDASPDATAEIGSRLAKDDTRVTFRRHITNKGHIATYNEGIEWAEASYLLLLSADDYLLPGALERAVSFMDEHSHVGLTFGRVLDEVDGEAEPAASAAELAGSDNGTWELLTGSEFIARSGAQNIVGTPSAIVRTSLQKRFGGYRPELPHSGDMEMWYRFAAYGAVGITSATQAVYRRHASNMSRAYTTDGWLPDLRQRQAAIEYFLQNHAPQLPEADSIGRRLRYQLACRAVSFASSAFNEGEFALSHTLCGFAREVTPDVESSSQWRKLSCKRLVGHRLWNALGPVRKARAVVRRMPTS